MFQGTSPSICGRRMSDPAREPGIGVDPARGNIHLPMVDLGLKKGELRLSEIFDHVDVPGAQRAIASRVPTIAALAQLVLEIIGRIGRPDPPCGFARPFQSLLEGGFA